MDGQRDGSVLTANLFPLVVSEDGLSLPPQEVPRHFILLKQRELESRLLGEISITSDMQMTPLLWQKPKTKEPLDESDRGE